MSILKIALNETFKEEGLWSDGKGKNKNDAGGRTYMGIAEKMNPDWGGWAIIDKHLNDKNFPQCLENIPELQKLVDLLYDKRYWDIIWGDKILNQKIANNLFDTAVNMGPNTAIKLLQRSLEYKETGKMDENFLTIINKIQ